MAYRVKYTAMTVNKWSIKLPHIWALQSSQPHVIMSFGLLTWQHYSWESCRVRQEKEEKKKLLSIKPSLVLITASCLCWVLQKGSQASLPPPPHPDIQASCPGATQEARARALTMFKQQGETGPEGAETVWEKEKKHICTNTHTILILSENMQHILFEAVSP